MRYFLAKNAVLKLLENPSVYQMETDELYELDNGALTFLSECSSESGHESEETGFVRYCLQEGILTSCAVPARRWPLIKSPDPSLRYLELQITDKCNLKCGHCYLGDGRSRELPVRHIRNLLHEFEELQGLRVLITGGEPFLHSGFDEINAMLPDFAIRKVLVTNGLLLHERILDTLHVDEIQISIDGLEDAHDSLRGKGTFRTAMEKIKLSRAYGFEVSVSTMIHSKNLGDFDEMERLLKDMGIREWTVDVPCVTGRLAAREELQVSHREAGKYLLYGYGAGLHGSAEGFACGLHLASVTAEGTVSKCTFYANRAAGRIEEGLGECWKRIKPIRLDTLKCDCVNIESCRGGCRYRADVLGDPMGKDLYRCALYDIIDY